MVSCGVVQAAAASLGGHWKSWLGAGRLRAALDLHIGALSPVMTRNLTDA